jgi:hypothetical protein
MNIHEARQAITVLKPSCGGSDLDAHVARCSRRPHRRAAAPVMLAPPQRLLLRDQAAEVPVRPAIPAARAAGSSRFAEIRPAVLPTRSATTAATRAPA